MEGSAMTDWEYVKARTLTVGDSVILDGFRANQRDRLRPITRITIIDGYVCFDMSGSIAYHETHPDNDIRCARCEPSGLSRTVTPPAR